MRLLALLFACLLPFSAARAEEFLPKVTRIVFLGDSITYAGDYVDQFDLFLRAAYPGRRFEVLDLGLPSETVSGLSEEGHAGGKFPRPDLHERLDRVLAKTKPDLVIACYGMNDGIYLPPSPERLQKFQSGVQRLREKVTAAGAQIVHLTPPVFDAVPLGPKVSPDGLHGPFAGYDEVLTQFATWLMSQKAAGWRVIDVHTPMRAELQAKRAADPAFKFAGDGVHANAAGHAIMARALIEGLGQKFDPTLAEKNAALYKLIGERRKLLSNAWLTECGHQRPGMAKGVPVEEATAKAEELRKKIEGEKL
ncbi:MAG TPA: SGNH/GDSL hydrolase family protein, partial [Chthoniobacteraceae bacterium]|nr:SGNH/GDSL hydrolase family protein [Chthoniobacteraceae bacterium]